MRCCFLRRQGRRNVGEAGASLLIRQAGRFLQVLDQPGDIGTMGSRRIFEVEELHPIGRGIDLAGEKVGIRGNGEADLRQPFPYVSIVGHHGEHAGVRIAFIASASPAVQRGFERIIVRGAPVAAKEDKPGKIFC